MAIHRYTNEELRHLRESPLAKKPDRLPPIEQWIDESQQASIPADKAARPATARVPRTNVSGDKSPMGNFSTGQRPSLLHTRTAGSRSGDDFMSSLPKTALGSARSVTRLTSFATNPSGADNAEEDQEGGIRLGNDKHHTRKTTSTFDRENWTIAREKKALTNGEHLRTDSNGERTLRPGRDGDKPDSRWPTREDRRPNNDRQGGGWRDREANRRDRPWDRHDQNEREPEWFDEPAGAKQDSDFSSMGQPRTQEDFQKWKDTMNASKKPQAEPEPNEAPPQEPPRKALESLKIDGLIDRPFGASQTIKSPDIANQTGKGAKASRFASMFKKEDALPVQEPSMQPEHQHEHPPSSAPAALVPDNKDDKEGFQRILQMLGGASTSANALPSPAEPRSPPKSAASGSRQRSRFFDSAKSPDTAPALPPLNMDASIPISTHSSDTQKLGDQQNMPRSQHDRSMSGYQGGASTPDINIQNLVASQRPQRSAASNKDSEFLLGLLQGAGARPSSQTSHLNIQPPPWALQQSEPYALNSRGPAPPGYVERDNLGPNDGLRGPHQQQQQQRELTMDSSSGQQPPRPPPGFDDHARMMHTMHQRPGPDPTTFQPPQFDPNQPRRPPGLPPGLPPGMVLPQHAMHHQQPHMPTPLPHEMPFMQPLPPGLPPHLAHPQGFANMPNMFQALPQQMPPQPRHFRGPSNMNGSQMPHTASAPPGLGRGMPPQNNNQAPPGLGGPKDATLNGMYHRAPQADPYEARR